MKIATLAIAFWLMAAGTAMAQKQPPAASGASAPFDFQGSIVGTDFRSWVANHPEATCSDGDIAGETICSVPKPSFISSWGEVKYRFYGEPADQAKLFQISIIASQINDKTLMDGLRGKWGTPNASTSLETAWSRPTSTISVISSRSGITVWLRDKATHDAYVSAEQKKAAAAM